MIRRLSLIFANSIDVSTRLASSAARAGASEDGAFRNALFNKFKDSHNAVCVDKVVVKVRDGDSEECAKNVLINKGVTTPFHVAKHISRHKSRSAVLCILEDSNGESISSMHSPIQDQCTVHFVDYSSAEYAKEVNETFWRSSSFLLGALSGSFNTPVSVEDYISDVSKGFFACVGEASGLQSYIADSNDLTTLSRVARDTFIRPELDFETLSLRAEDVEQFQLNVNDASVNENGMVSLCRLGSYVNIVQGHLIPNTRHIGRFAVIKALERNGSLCMSGVALPAEQTPSDYVWQLICERGIQQADKMFQK